MPDLPETMAGEDQYSLAAAQIRATAKWLIAAFASIGAVLVAGVQLSKLGQLHGARLADALVSIAVGFLGVGVALVATARVLTPEGANPENLLQDRRFKRVRQDISKDRSLLRGQATDLGSLLGEYHAAVVASDGEERTDDDPVEDPERMHDLAAVVGGLLRLAVYYRIVDLFRHARVAVFTGAILVGAGAVGVAYFANPPTGGAALSSEMRPAYRVRLLLTPNGARLLREAGGSHCRRAPSQAVMIGGRANSPDVVTMPADGCPSIRLNLDRSYGATEGS